MAIFILISGITETTVRYHVQDVPTDFIELNLGVIQAGALSLLGVVGATFTFFLFWQVLANFRNIHSRVLASCMPFAAFVAVIIFPFGDSHRFSGSASLIILSTIIWQALFFYSRTFIDHRRGNLSFSHYLRRRIRLEKIESGRKLKKFAQEKAASIFLSLGHVSFYLILALYFGVVMGLNLPGRTRNLITFKGQADVVSVGRFGEYWILKQANRIDRNTVRLGKSTFLKKFDDANYSEVILSAKFLVLPPN